MTIYNCIPRIELGHQQSDASNHRGNLGASNTVLQRHFKRDIIVLLIATYSNHQHAGKRYEPTDSGTCWHTSPKGIHG